MSGAGLAQKAGTLFSNVIEALRSHDNRSAGQENDPQNGTSILGSLKNLLSPEPVRFTEVKNTAAFQQEMRLIYRCDQTDRLEQRVASGFAGGPYVRDKVHDALVANEQRVSSRARWLSENTLAEVDLKDSMDCHVRVRLLGTESEQSLLRHAIKNHEEAMSGIDARLGKAIRKEQWTEKGTLIHECEEQLGNLSRTLKAANMELIIPALSPGQPGRYYIARMQEGHQSYPPGICDAINILNSRGHYSL